MNRPEANDRCLSKQLNPGLFAHIRIEALSPPGLFAQPVTHSKSITIVAGHTITLVNECSNANGIDER